MQIILVKTTTCAKCRQFQPIFEEYCKNNNIEGRVICFDTASNEDKKLATDTGIETVPSLIFIENSFKRSYNDVLTSDGITRAKNDFLASKGV